MSPDPLVGELRRVVHGAAGLVVGGPRTEVLVAVATEQASRRGLDLGGYVQRLPTDGETLADLLEALVVGETFFGRIPEQRQALRDVVLPAVLDAAARTAGRRVRLWSAGCSTGEEAWDVAMVLAGLLDARPGPQLDARVIGTDLSRRAIRTAEHGEYSARAVALLPADERDRYLTPLAGRWCVGERLRRLVDLRVANLVVDPPPEASLDVVLLRNVTIYFDRETTRRLLTAVRAALRPGGWLLLGHSETLWQLFDGFDLEQHGDAFLYRRPATERSVTPAGRRDGRRDAAPAAHRPLLAQQPPPGAEARRSRTPSDDAAPPPGPAPGDPLRAARRALDSGAWRAAASAAASAVDQDPLAPEAHQMQGHALVELGRDDEALLALRRAAYLDPGDGLAHLLLGGVLGRLGRSAESARAYATAADALLARPSAGIAPGHAQELSEMCRQLAAEA